MSYSLPNEGLVKVKDVLKVIPVGKSSWWSGVKSGRFPKPIKLSTRNVAWDVVDIRKLLQEMISKGKNTGEN